MTFTLFWTFFKIGLFTFGGGYAMIAQVKETIVENKKWLNEDELLQIITIAESTPGPIAINMATYIGYKKRGVLGSAFATLGVVLPSLMIIFAISLFLDAFMQNVYVQYAFTGIKCAVAFLIMKAGWNLFVKMQKKPLPLATFLSVFALLIVLELLSLSFSSIFLILIGGVIGIFVYAVFAPKKTEPLPVEQVEQAEGQGAVERADGVEEQAVENRVEQEEAQQ